MLWAFALCCCGVVVLLFSGVYGCCRLIVFVLFVYCRVLIVLQLCCPDVFLLWCNGVVASLFSRIVVVVWSSGIVIAVLLWWL